jgi:hypothetical protein
VSALKLGSASEDGQPGGTGKGSQGQQEVSTEGEVAYQNLHTLGNQDVVLCARSARARPGRPDHIHETIIAELRAHLQGQRPPPSWPVRKKEVARGRGRASSSGDRTGWGSDSIGVPERPFHTEARKVRGRVTK